MATKASSPADILMAVDAGNLVDLVDKGSDPADRFKVLKDAVPAQPR